jgi:hypothetical protein
VRLNEVVDRRVRFAFGGAETTVVYPSQSGIEIQPSSRYRLCGLAGMLEGRCPDLIHASHSFLLFSLSFRTSALAAAKGSMSFAKTRPSPYPSQSGIEIQSSRYVLDGVDGTFAGRFPDLLHFSQSFLLFNLSFRTIALAAWKGSTSLRCVTPVYPSQSGHEIQPLSRYIEDGPSGMFDGRFPALPHACHSFSLFSLSFLTIALAAANGSMSLAKVRRW